MTQKIKLPAIILTAIFLNMSGAIIGKIINLNLENLFKVFFFTFLLGLSFILRFGFWIRIAKTYQLSYIYPFISLAYLLSLPIGKYLFNEEISINNIIGASIIFLGVGVVSFSKFKN